MITVGLTGSIGMGKTVTAKMFQACGAAVFNADVAVHALYARGGAAVPILRAGLPDTIVNGAVDRAKLSEALAQNPLLFGVLESFIHPLVAQMRAAAMADAKSRGVKIFIDDVPLLFETGGDKRVDKTVVVTAPYAVQRDRVLARPNMSEDKFKSILARQMPDAEKRRRANFVVNSGAGLDAAREQVEKIVAQLLAAGETHDTTR
ncbi:dephospho-CoA kinase [Robiginitomaculum antarcticum]|uniref:dephospho-CoA kinase n=1 Tax=Robiginitomaculum antarcticum TaxID=437507 RepID=UPI00037FED49|nr:dephospho-CoA kinase [Robiginitomaculum antarcticum]